MFETFFSTVLQLRILEWVQNAFRSSEDGK